MATAFRASGAIIVTCLLVDAPIRPAAAGWGPDLDAMERHRRTSERRASPEPRAPARGTAPSLALPEPLGAADVERYRRIFALQREAKWDEADALIAELRNPKLLGYVRQQRYLAPDYRTSFEELAAWLEAHGDHPEAERLHRLALSRRPAGAAAPAQPRDRPENDSFWTGRRTVPLPVPRLTAAQMRRHRAHRRTLTEHIRRDRLTIAQRLLAQDGMEAVLGAAWFDRYRADIGKRWFQFGEHDKAWAVAAPASDRSAALVAEAAWIAGLSGWALEKYREAGGHFERVWNAPGESEWLRAGAAYWAGRSYEADGDAKTALIWFERAATLSRTFYGVLAGAKLGRPHDFAWAVPEPDPAELTAILDSPTGRRAAALLQVGKRRVAEQELRRLYFLGGGARARSFMAIAAEARLPALSLGISRLLYTRDATIFDGALYPVPTWAPPGGFALDRAMVLAIMRQESAFDPEALSHAGARGLMQLMPATASFIADDRSLRGPEVDRLYDPEFNIDLGQKFFLHLLDRPRIRNNLFFALAAYNAGEGNLNRWRVRDDPLLFIEAMYIPETRLYVERVMYNLWVYRWRFGQETPSLDALVKGRWPRYRALDGTAAPDERVLDASRGEDDS